MHQCLDTPTYSNLQCHDCLQSFNVCLHPLCTSSRLFCQACSNLTQHNSHIEFVFPTENIISMLPSAVINVPHPLIVTQKQTLEKILCQIDAFENDLQKSIKSLRSNLGEKYALISQSLESNGHVYVDNIQEILRRYTAEYASGFDVKLSNLLQKPSVTSSHIFDLQTDKWQQLQDIALSNIKAIQDTIKLKHEKSLNPLLAVPWGNTINAFSIHKDTIALAGQYLRIMQGKHYEGKLNINFYDDPIRSISYSRDGSLLALAGGSKCTLFNTSSMKPLALKLLTQHNAQFHSVDISPDNKLIAFGVKSKKSGYKTCIGDIQTEEIKQILFDNNSLVLSLKFSRDNRYLALAGCDYAVFVYHRETPDQQFVKTQILRDNDDIISEIAFSEDSKILVSGSVDGRCYIYSRKNNNSNEEVKQILNDNQINDTTGQKIDSNSSHEEKKQEDDDNLEKFEEETNPQSTLESNESRSHLAYLEEQFQKLNKQDIEETKPGNLNESIQKVLVDVAKRNQQKSDEDYLREEAQKIMLGRDQIHANPFVAQSMLSDSNYISGKIEERKRENQNQEQQLKEDPENISYSSQDLSSKYELVSYFKLSKAISIRSIHIHQSSTFLAIATSNEILLYDILEISTPRLLYTFPTNGKATVNQIRFSPIADILYFSDNTGQFYSTKFR